MWPAFFIYPSKASVRLRPRRARPLARRGRRRRCPPHPRAPPAPHNRVCPYLPRARRMAESRDSEVGPPHPALGVEQHFGGFEVAVQHPSGTNGLLGSGQLQRHRTQLGRRQGTLSFQPSSEVLPRERARAEDLPAWPGERADHSTGDRSRAGTGRTIVGALKRTRCLQILLGVARGKNSTAFGSKLSHLITPKRFEPCINCNRPLSYKCYTASEGSRRRCRP